MPNIALFFGALLGGAVIMDYGVKNVKAGAVTTSSATPAAPTSTATATSSSATGSVTRTDLVQVGSGHKWDASELDAWQQVITMESGGDPHSVNSSSGAAGIAQFISGFGEYAKYGGDANTVTGQLTAMANYISQRYGTPSAALAHENAYHWY